MSEARDRWLAELYRASAQEQPSASSDRIVLAAARDGPRGRRPFYFGWGAPLAAAAVVVVAVSLVIAVRDEADYNVGNLDSRQSMEPARSTADDFTAKPPAAVEKAPLSARESRESDSGPARDAIRARKAQEQAQRSPIPEQALAESAAPAPAAESPLESSARRKTTAPSATTPALPAETPRPPIAPVAKPAPAAPAVASPRASANAPADAMGSRAERSAERGAALGTTAREEAASEPKRADRQEIPDSAEKWIERILALQADGRLSEAKEDLAAFRARYPDHPLPEKLLRLRAGQ